MAKFIDLGREYDSCCKPAPCCDSSSEKKKSYPTLYISGITGLDLSMGEITFTAKGKVVSVSRRERDGEGDQCSCEIEVHSISAPGAKPEESEEADSRLDKELTKIEKKKMEDGDD